jgi:oligopeptide transport system substrate-binding protein
LIALLIHMRSISIHKELLIMAACIALLPVACHSAKERDSRQVFRYNESKGIPTLDPAFARSLTVIWPMNQIYNGLVQVDDSLRVQPCIARKWTISDNGRRYTFLLRNDVYFHDHPVFPGGIGRKVTAKDVVFSFSRILDPSVASPGAWIFSQLDRAKTTDSLGFKAVNDSVFEIYLTQAFPAFAGILSMTYCSIVPREIVEHFGPEFRKNPVGTGPFMFKKWYEGEKLILLRNPRYFEMDPDGNRLPYLDAVNIGFVNDKQSEFLEFLNGNIDFLSGVYAVSKDELVTKSGKLQSRYEDRFRMQVYPYLNTEYLGFLSDTMLQAPGMTPARMKKIRQAINYGFDRAKMLRYLRNNLGNPATSGFVPDGLPSFDSSMVRGYRFDPVRAAKLLNEAGYAGGQGLPVIPLITTSDYLDLCEYIQHELMNLGLRVSIEVTPGPAYRELMANGHALLFRGSWVADYPEAENYLALFYSRNRSPGGPNYIHFSNPRFDRLYLQSFSELDEQRRYQLYQEMDRIIIEEAPVVPLFYDEVIRFTRKNISGLGINPMNLLSLKTVKKIE